MIVKATARQKWLAFTSWRGQWDRWMKLVSPQVIAWMARKGVADAAQHSLYTSFFRAWHRTLVQFGSLVLSAGRSIRLHPPGAPHLQ